MREELENRGQSTEGSLATLRTRLTRCEICAQLGLEAPRVSTLLEPPEISDHPGVALAGRVGPLTSAGPTATTSGRPTIARTPRPPPRVQLSNENLEPRYNPRNNSSGVDVYQLMRRWNLHFSGARGSDAEAFLVRSKEGRALVSVSDDEIFKCIPFFLSGIALYWYRTARGQWRDWRDFEVAWRTRFGSPDFQFALRDEIIRRTQGEREPVADYLTCMRALFERLDTPWTLDEQLNYTHRNMLPRLRVSVPRRTVYDFASLETSATLAEESYEAVNTYRAPPKPEQSVCPDLAYRPPRKESKASIAVAAAGVADLKPSKISSKEKSRRSRAEKPANPSATAATDSANAADTSGRTNGAAVSCRIKCWNCEKLGHFARDCQAEKRIYCYRCGRARVTVKDCPSCAGNEDGSR